MMVPVVPMAETKCVTRPPVPFRDLRPRALVVGAPVVAVRELVEHQVAALGDLSPCVVDRSLHAGGGGREHDRGPVGAHRLDPLGRRVLRHHELERVAPERRDHRQRDTGIAAGRLDQPDAGTQFAALLGVLDHPVRGAVLDTAARVLSLELCQELHVPRRCELAELDQGRVADHIGKSHRRELAPASAPSRTRRAVVARFPERIPAVPGPVGSGGRARVARP